MRTHFTSSQKQEVLKQAQTFWTAAGTAQEQFYSNVSDRERMARSLLPQSILDIYEKNPDKSCLAPPDFLINISSLRAAVHNLVFGSRPFGRVSRYGDQDMSNPVIKKAEALLQHQNDLGEVESASDLAVHQALYGGVGVSMTAWRRKIVGLPKRYDADEGGRRELIVDSNGNAQIEQKVVAEYVEDIPIDIRRVRIDPSVDKLSDVRIVGRHYIDYYSELVRMNRNENHFYKFSETALHDSTFDHQEFYKYVPGESQALEKGKPNEGFGDKAVEVKEVQGIYRIKRGNDISYEDLIVHYANDNILLGVMHNNVPIPSYKLYDFVVVDDEHARLFPMGVLEPAQDLWIFLFRLLNNLLDSSNRDTYAMYLGDKSALSMEDEYITYEDGKIIMLDSFGSGIGNVSNAFAPLQRHSQSQGPFNLVLAIQNMIQQVMKLSDYIQGSDPTRAETATAVEALIQGGQSLLFHLVSKVARSYYIPSWRRKIILWNFWKGQERHKIQLDDGELLNLEPGELDYLFQVAIDTKANHDRPSMVRRFVESLPILKMDPNIEQYELSKSHVEVMKLPNSDRLLKNYRLLDVIIEKENIAMAEGAPQPVDPEEPHEVHNPGHKEFLENPPVKLTREAIDIITDHMAQHDEQIEIRNKGQLGNTKELGGNAGQLASPAQPSITKSKSQPSNALKSESRA